MRSKIFVSVIIPTYNRLNYLKECLESLFIQTLDKHLYEIIIVDDGSTDNTKEYIKKLQKAQKIPKMYYYRQKNQGPAMARNLGARYAKGKFLAFLDDDCIAHKSWLNQIVLSFDKFPEVAYIGGYSIPILKQSFFKSITSWKKIDGKKKYRLIENVTRGQNGLERLVYTDNSAIRKSAFLDVKGFTNIRYGEDCDLCLKLLDKKYLVYRVFSIQVDHNQRDTISSLFKRSYGFGKLSVNNYKTHYNGYTLIDFGWWYIYAKTGFTIYIQRNFFKDMLFVILISFFWPLLALILLLLKLSYILIFETKSLKTNMSLSLFYLITQSAFFFGNIVGSFKNKILNI